MAEKCILYITTHSMPRKWNPNGDKNIIHIGADAAHINARYEPMIEAVGNITDTLRQIQRRSSRDSEPEWAFAIREQMVADYTRDLHNDSFPLKPQRILGDIREVMAAGSILLSDVGAHKMWIARGYNSYTPGTCIISNGFASMGIAVPGAVAAKLVYPDKQVLAVCGDGGFMMNMQELETAKRIGAPFVTLILNDSAYGLIKWKQDEQFGHHCFVDFTNPDFVLLAEAMGCKGYRVQSANDLIPMLRDAFCQEVPAVIDCPVDYAENIKLSQYLEEQLGRK